MTLATIFALFGEDLRLAAFEKYADNFFFTLSFIAFIMFTVEIALSSYAKPDYIFKFYFWLDFVATVSLLPDIGWLVSCCPSLHKQ